MFLSERCPTLNTRQKYRLGMDRPRKVVPLYSKNTCTLIVRHLKLPKLTDTEKAFGYLCEMEDIVNQACLSPPI